MKHDSKLGRWGHLLRMERLCFTLLFLWCTVLGSQATLLGGTLEEINSTHSCHLRFKCFCDTAQLNQYLAKMWAARGGVGDRKSVV